MEVFTYELVSLQLAGKSWQVKYDLNYRSWISSFGIFEGTICRRKIVSRRILSDFVSWQATSIHPLLKKEILVVDADCGRETWCESFELAHVCLCLAGTQQGIAIVARLKKKFHY